MSNKLSDGYQLSAKTATATGDTYSWQEGDGSLHVHVFSASTSTATVLVEQSLDGTTWFTSQTVTNPSSTGVYLLGPIAPFNRVRISARSAGTVSAYLTTMKAPATEWKSITAQDSVAAAGGSTTQLQYNNSGSLAGMTATWDGTTLALTGDQTVSGTLGVTGAVTCGALTAGRVPYVGTAGLVKDEAALAYDEATNTLTAGIHKGGKQDTISDMAVDGAIAVAPGTIFATKAGVLAATLPLPTAVTHDGYEITVVATTANANTVTTPAAGINGSLTTATFGGAAGDFIKFKARNGSWWALERLNVTLS